MQIESESDKIAQLMNDPVVQSFSVTKRQMEKITSWVEQITEDYLKENNVTMDVAPPDLGTLSYVFTPTVYGTVVEVGEMVTGKCHEITNSEDWEEVANG